MNDHNIMTRDGRDVIVRPLAEGDGNLIHQFDAHLSPETRAYYFPHAYDESTLEKIVQRAVTGKDRAYLAIDQDTVAGYFFLWEFDKPIPVLGIGIADAYQGLGLGRAFMNILIEDAQSAGRDGIELTTVPKNVRAFALYRKLGFVHTRDTDNVAGDGRIVREHVMFLPLREGATAPIRNFEPPV